jgi:hypothetical protein
MAFGTSSKVFTAFMAQAMGGSGATNNLMASKSSGTYAGLCTDTLKVALYNDSATPNNAAAYDSTGYNTGGWTNTNEQFSSTQWPAGGVTLAGAIGAVSSNVFKFDATDTASSGSVTLSGVMGCLIYDNDITGTNTVAKQGVCYNYFGGAQSVTSGTFTVVWNSSGIFTITT